MADEVKYARFWQRATREFLLWTFGLAMLFSPHIGGVAGCITGGVAFACALAYGSLRENYSHIEVVGASGKEIGFFRGILRQFVVMIPVIAWGIESALGRNAFEARFTNYADVVNGCAEALDANFCGRSLKATAVDYGYLPLLFLTVALMNAPVFFTPEKRSVADLIMRTRVIYVDKGDGRFARYWRGALFIPCLALMITFAAATAWVLWNLHDAELNPKAEAFFKDHPYQAEDNFYTAWNGLNAPADVKDIYTYGLNLAKGSVKPDPGQELHFHYVTGSFCYTQDQFRNVKDCSDLATAQKGAADNAILLDRYRSLYKYKNHDSGTDSKNFNINDDDSDRLHNMMVGLWAAQAHAGQTEDIPPQWIDDMRFTEASLGGRHTTFGACFWMRNYANNLVVLPLIINTPALALRYRDQILPLLAKEFPDPSLYNVLAQAQQDYYPLSDMQLDKFPGDEVFVKPNDTRNALYDLAQQLDAVSRTPPKDLAGKIEELEQAYPRLQFFNTFGRGIVSNRASTAGNYFLYMTEDTAWARALTLYVNAKAADVAPADMEAFLGKAAPAQFDPYAQKPFRWDAKTGSITWNNDKGERRDIYY